MQPNKVPDLKIIQEILDKHFDHTPVGGYAEKDENGVVYIYHPNGDLFAFISEDIYLNFLNKENQNEI